MLATGKRRIGFIGLSFKTGTDDLRESPLVLLAEQLIGKGAQLSVYDPEVHLSRLLGANKSFIERHLPHIGDLLCADVEQVIRDAEVLIVGLSTPAIVDALSTNVREDQWLLDVAGIKGRLSVRGEIEGLCW